MVWWTKYKHSMILRTWNDIAHMFQPITSNWLAKNLLLKATNISNFQNKQTFEANVRYTIQFSSRNKCNKLCSKFSFFQLVICIDFFILALRYFVKKFFMCFSYQIKGSLRYKFEVLRDSFTMLSKCNSF